MLTPDGHRKLVRHYDLPGHARELTFSCYQRWPLLTDVERLRMLSLAIDRAVANHGFGLVAFVYMPEHLHLIVFPLRPDAAVELLLYAIKRPFSYRMKQELEQRGDRELLRRLTIQERPGKLSFRFWQEGPGYDRNITDPDELRVAIQYLHDNPVRRGLCQRREEWKWSSWAAYDAPERERDSDLPVVHGWPHR